MTTKLITVDPEIHSGTPVFFETRVPIKTLFDHLEAGDSMDVFLDDFPSVSRELAVAFLEQARWRCTKVRTLASSKHLSLWRSESYRNWMPLRHWIS